MLIGSCSIELDLLPALHYYNIIIPLSHFEELVNNGEAGWIRTSVGL